MFRTESFPYACVPLVEREREREREEKHRSNELWRESSRENSSAFRSFDSENGKEAERALDKLLRVIFVSPNFLNQRSSRNIFEFANARVDSRRVILESSRLVIVEFVIPFTTSAPRRPYESIMPIELSNRRWETGTGSRGVVPRCVNPTRWFLFFFFRFERSGLRSQIFEPSSRFEASETSDPHSFSSRKRDDRTTRHRIRIRSRHARIFLWAEFFLLWQDRICYEE